jgi:hypothetical protein
MNIYIQFKIKTNEMKKTIPSTIMIVSMVLLMLTGCTSSSKKVKIAKENVAYAKENVVDAHQKLNQALSDSVQDYKKHSKEKLLDNEKSLALYKVRIVRENKENKAIYEKEWSALVKKNDQMKLRLENYNEAKDGKWESFKKKFDHDMDELGEAFKELK